jgi:hypothetical protein
MNLSASLLVAALLPLGVQQGPAQTPPQPQTTNPIGSAVLGFKQRLAAYVKVHNEAESKVAKLTKTNDPAQVHDREAALGETIKGLRASAKEGDVFGADFRPVLERAVREDFHGRPAADRKALIQELPAHVKIGVNMTYPGSLPLATFPARLLTKLPDLPPELEYRIVGHHILLRDVTANVIVDVARNIVPTLPS